MNRQYLSASLVFGLLGSACASDPAGSRGAGSTSTGGAGGADTSTSSTGASMGSAGSSTGGAGGGPTGCATDLDCPCGEVCAGGVCSLSDCSINNCPGADKGRVCSCQNGILDVDGATGLQWPTSDVVLRRRPIVAADHGTELLLRNYHVHDATNMKGVHVTMCSGEGWEYTKATLSCIEVNNVVRDAAGMQAGLHMDYIKVDGCMMGTPAEVILEDVYVHDGNVYSLFSDVRLTLLVLRRVKHENTEGALQIGTLSQPDSAMAGYFDEVRIDQSPGLHVALLGNKIGKVVVLASPGVTGTEKTGTPVIYDEASCPARALFAHECCQSAGETCGL
ncbi:MAG TPA: hypothetical protein VK459_04300 [Polyangiaceae bacterium]|nr:hypothetical protein [Polyangiaceae bacterium]